ncbi:hypothetical protein [Deinococcus sp. QL22]|uniref:hypothetical protein n=1 Tax=Deinococcus sp. QL22 TaxID=2939437 RepID=UPI0020180986|nr:hypothetical protein [Deinococcus sp. QL22]UQN05287.1 hypothetical protein M1R55_10350 [Deinococcus sp. QL22]
MSPLVFVACESYGKGAWRLEAHFHLAAVQDFLIVLASAGIAGRGHPPDLSVSLEAELLFEEEVIAAPTYFAASELGRLLGHAPPELAAQFRAWHALTRAFEGMARPARLIVWQIE